MKKNGCQADKSEWNAGVGAAIGVLLGSAFADLIAPGSSVVGLIGLTFGAMIGAILGRRESNKGSDLG